METVDLTLERGGYPIHIGEGLLDGAALLEPHLGPTAMVVTNGTVAPLYLARVSAALAGREHASVVLPDGEEHKTLAVLGQVFDALVERRFGRDTTLIALGGGVVGDMTGFAAACYQRGVAFVQMPTTLLAQVDASVGGKTAVNHPGGKNLIGAFHQPRCVVADVATLDTLPDRELRSGLAEVVKHALIADAAFFAWLEENVAALLRRERGPLVHAIRRCCEIKAAFVADDERERGRRALLNLGHTFGHAIETETAYEWLHGEAVAAGMALAADMSVRTGALSGPERERILALLAAAGLPSRPPPVSPARLLERMRVDKKAVAGELRLVLLEAIGAARISADYPAAALRAVLEEAGA